MSPGEAGNGGLCGGGAKYYAVAGPLYEYALNQALMEKAYDDENTYRIVRLDKVWYAR